MFTSRMEHLLIAAGPNSLPPYTNIAMHICLSS